MIPRPTEGTADRAKTLAAARQRLQPAGTKAALRKLGARLGSSPIVALGESGHFIAEPLEFRNLLFRHLADEHGFRTIALETGLVEGRLIHDYVLGGPGDLDEVVTRGFSWTFDRLPQNRALVEWMRAFNAVRAPKDGIRFYGFDIAGSPANPRARRKADTSLRAVLDYLLLVDPGAAGLLAGRLDPFWPNLRFDIWDPADKPGYGRLSSTDRDALSQIIGDTVSELTRNEARYAKAGSPGDYDWALRSAIVARQVDHWLREVPLDWHQGRTAASFIDRASDLRDEAQADNIEWIRSREGPGRKLLLFAHNNHIAAHRTLRCWHERRCYERRPAGLFLKTRYGDDYLVIGHVSGADRVPDEDGSQESLEGFCSELGAERFTLDLRRWPESGGAWLEKPHRLGKGFEFGDCSRYSDLLQPRASFDLLYFTQSATPAATSISDE